MKTEIELIKIAQCGGDQEAKEAMKELRERFNPDYFYCNDCDYAVVLPEECCLNQKPRCYICEQEVEEYYWENLFRGFCSLECTNEYLESEGFNPISGPNESATVKEEYRNL